MSRLPQLLKMLETSPNEPFILFAVAKEYEQTQQPDEALRYYLHLRQAHPNYVGLYYHLGKLYERLQRLAEAFRTYTEGMQQARAAGDQHALSELAGARLELGDEDDFA